MLSAAFKASGMEPGDKALRAQRIVVRLALAASGRIGGGGPQAAPQRVECWRTRRCGQLRDRSLHRFHVEALPQFQRQAGAIADQNRCEITAIDGARAFIYRRQ